MDDFNPLKHRKGRPCKQKNPQQLTPTTGNGEIQFFILVLYDLNYN